jgi:NAD(P)-dependent dehydrogenase (short-subunit alcohol dehydrogenase family)
VSVLDRFSLKGKVAVVTGGAGLYGRQIVTALAEAGADTYTAARNLEALEKQAAEHRSRGLRVTALPLDQGSESSILSLRDEVIKRSGHVDVLINNALARAMKRAFADSADAFAASMQVNATGLFLISRAFGDAMAERGRGGSIVNVASIHGMIAPDPTLYEGTDMPGFFPDYFFHKAGMINFTKFLASYYGRKGGIRCNAISPGGYGEQAHPLHLERYNARTCLGRRANDTDLMGVIVFLASDASLYITGANIPVDAGYTAM